MEIKGTKLVELPYMAKHLEDVNKSVLIVGERKGDGDAVSPTVKEMGFDNVTTTDILEKDKGSWLEKNTDWDHVTVDFIKFDESLSYDYIVGISVFEHFGFWFAGNRMADGLTMEDDMFHWNHDLKAISKCCKLLKDGNSKVIITLPAGPYMNYEDTGEPFLRYYDRRRENIVKEVIKNNNCKVVDERYYFSEDFEEWEEMDKSINTPKYYYVINPYSPNLIWAFTIQKE